MARLVNAAVRNLDLTKVIIAHRPETIASADRVLEVRGGGVAGRGQKSSKKFAFSG